MEAVNNSTKDRYRTGKYISISFGNLITEFFLTAFGTRVFDYYGNEIGLDSWIISAAIICYAIWNMLNDPIIGYISDKPRKWWSKWGKRRPWILGAILPLGISFVILFLVPNFDPETTGGKTSLFLWLLFTSIIFDTCFSIFGTNFNSILPELFRTDKERIKQSSIGIFMSTIGLVMGTTIPSIFGKYNDQFSWIIGAVLVAIIGCFAGFMMRPGTIESPDMIARAKHCIEEEERGELCEEEKRPFFSTLRKTLKDKNYVAYLILIVCYQCLNLLMVSSIPYLNRFIITPTIEPESLIFVGPVIATLLSIPFWYFLTKKIGNTRMIIIGGILIICAGVPFLFISNAVTVIIFICFMGIAQVAFGMQLSPILADVVDELVAKIGKRQEGFVIGIRTLFARFGLVIQAITIALVHLITGFDQNSTSQTPLALL
ncbi:MAG: MFS transporter [Promethearchaeota archaeon]